MGTARSARRGLLRLATASILVLAGCLGANGQANKPVYAADLGIEVGTSSSVLLMHYDIFDYYTPANAEERREVLWRQILFRERVFGGDIDYEEVTQWPRESLYVSLMTNEGLFEMFMNDDDFAERLMYNLMISVDEPVQIPYIMEMYNLAPYSPVISPGTGS